MPPLPCPPPPCYGHCKTVTFYFTVCFTVCRKVTVNVTPVKKIVTGEARTKQLFTGEARNNCYGRSPWTFLLRSPLRSTLQSTVTVMGSSMVL